MTLYLQTAPQRELHRAVVERGGVEKLEHLLHARLFEQRRAEVLLQRELLQGSAAPHIRSAARAHASASAEKHARSTQIAYGGGAPKNVTSALQRAKMDD